MSQWLEALRQACYEESPSSRTGATSPEVKIDSELRPPDLNDLDDPRNNDGYMSVQMRTELINKNAAYEADKDNWHDVMADVTSQTEKDATPEQLLTQVVKTFGTDEGSSEKPIESPLEKIGK